MNTIYVNWTGETFRAYGRSKRELKIVDGDEIIRLEHGVPEHNGDTAIEDCWAFPALPPTERDVVHVVSRRVAEFLAGYGRTDVVYVKGMVRYVDSSHIPVARQLVRVRHALPDKYRADQRYGTYTDPRDVDNDNDETAVDPPPSGRAVFTVRLSGTFVG